MSDIKRFHLSVRDGEVHAVEKALAQHPEWLNVRLGDNQTWMHIAARRNQADVIRVLGQHGLDPDLGDMNDAKPLWLACVVYRSERAAQALLDWGADPNRLNRHGLRLMHYASTFPIGITRLLLMYGTEVDGIDRDSKSPLFQAVQEGYHAGVMVLLKAGADPHLRPKEGMETPLELARELGYRDIEADMQAWIAAGEAKKSIAEVSTSPSLQGIRPLTFVGRPGL